MNELVGGDSNVPSFSSAFTGYRLPIMDHRSPVIHPNVNSTTDFSASSIHKTPAAFTTCQRVTCDSPCRFHRGIRLVG